MTGSLGRSRIAGQVEFGQVGEFQPRRGGVGETALHLAVGFGQPFPPGVERQVGQVGPVEHGFDLDVVQIEIAAADPRQNEQLSGDVQAAEIVSRIRFRVAQAMGLADRFAPHVAGAQLAGQIGECARAHPGYRLDAVARAEQHVGGVQHRQARADGRLVEDVLRSVRPEGAKVGDRAREGQFVRAGDRRAGGQGAVVDGGQGAAGGHVDEHRAAAAGRRLA